MFCCLLGITKRSLRLNSVLSLSSRFSLRWCNSNNETPGSIEWGKIKPEYESILDQMLRDGAEDRFHQNYPSWLKDGETGDSVIAYFNRRSQIFTPQADWKRLKVWYNETREQKYDNIESLIRDVEEGGHFTVSHPDTSRFQLCKEFFDICEKLCDSALVSPYSFLVQGPQGIGKSTLVDEVGKRIVYLYPNLCCILYSLHKIGVCPTIEEILEESKRRIVETDKESNYNRDLSSMRFLVNLDDSEDVFKSSVKESDKLLVSLGRVCPPRVRDVAVQLYGSAMVLQDLFCNTLDESLVNEFSGYKAGGGGINAGKIISTSPQRPKSVDEVEDIGTSIAKGSGRVFDDQDLFISSWYCSGIPRYMEWYLRGDQSEYGIITSLWKKFNSNDIMSIYNDIVETNELHKKIKTMGNLKQYVPRYSPFNSIEPVNNYGSTKPLSVISALNKGFIFENNNMIYPTYPIFVLFTALQREAVLNFDLFLNTPIDPDLTLDMVNKQLKNNKYHMRSVELQRLELIKSCFNSITHLPGRNQLYRRVKNIISSSYKSDLMFGAVFMDILNFGAINANVSYDAADKMLKEFGDKFRSIVDSLNENITLCQVFHRSGDEFAILCIFENKEDFIDLGEKISRVKVVRNETPCYCRLGGYYTNNNKNIREGLYRAEKIEGKLKDPIAKSLGYVNSADMKAKTKTKGHKIKEIVDFTLLSEIVGEEEYKTQVYEC